jgi:hypothetical protein
MKKPKGRPPHKIDADMDILHVAKLDTRPPAPRVLRKYANGGKVTTPLTAQQMLG